LTCAILDLFGNPVDAEEGEDSDALSDTLLGRHAEFMVCAQICKAGYYVSHVDGMRFDLALSTDYGSFTIQVKSSTWVRNGRCGWSMGSGGNRSYDGSRVRFKKRGVSPKDADLLALYHHAYGTTIMMPILSEISWVSFSVSQVAQASLEQTLQSSLDELAAR
jgi:hypothetical protein